MVNSLRGSDQPQGSKTPEGSRKKTSFKSPFPSRKKKEEDSSKAEVTKVTNPIFGKEVENHFSSFKSGPELIVNKKKTITAESTPSKLSNLFSKFRSAPDEAKQFKTKPTEKEIQERIAEYEASLEEDRKNKEKLRVLKFEEQIELIIKEVNASENSAHCFMRMDCKTTEIFLIFAKNIAKAWLDKILINSDALNNAINPIVSEYLENYSELQKTQPQMTLSLFINQEVKNLLASGEKLFPELTANIVDGLGEIPEEFKHLICAFNESIKAKKAAKPEAFADKASELMAFRVCALRSFFPLVTQHYKGTNDDDIMIRAVFRGIFDYINRLTELPKELYPLFETELPDKVKQLFNTKLPE